MKVYEKLASLVDARSRCLDTGNAVWSRKHEDRIIEIVRAHMASGSGFDSGTTLDLDKSTGEKLVFCTAFHHMNDVGMYCRWTEHTVVVKPSLQHSVDVKVTGRDYNDIKDYIGECFQHSLLSGI